jgi:hypothetical protein
MNFKNYYEKVQKTFKFRIKAVYKLDDESMDVIEKVLDKYRPSKVGQPKKMMFQTQPLGFVGAKNVELYFIDVELTVPANPAVLEYDLRSAFHISTQSDIIQVFPEHGDPMEEAEEAAEEQHEAEETTALLNQPDYPEAAEVDPNDHFGDAYNKRFLEYVKEVEKKRDLNKKIDAPHPITKWEKQPDPNSGDPKQDTADFNADHKPATTDVKTQPIGQKFTPKKIETK